LTARSSVAIWAAVGIFDALKRKSPISKLMKQAKEPFAQPEYRREAMDKLFDIGTEEAYDAVLMRFTVAASGAIADEDEKRELVDRLVELGAPVLGPVKSFIKTQQKITFPVRALARMVPKAEAIEFLTEVVRQYEPADHRSIEAKGTLLATLGDLAEPSQAPLFIPYLKDHSDDVQFNVIVVLERLANPEAREPFCEVCCGDEHAQRIQRRAAEALFKLEWSVKEHYERFHPELKSEYLLGKKGLLVKKGA
jgi:hypothetical protein